MRKHEKFLLLTKYYSESRMERVFDNEFRSEDDSSEKLSSLTMRHEHMEMAWMLRSLVECFYAANPESQDALEMIREIEKVRDIATDDADNDRWMTMRELWKMFEGDCLDDDADWPPEWTKEEEAAWASYRGEDDNG